MLLIWAAVGSLVWAEATPHSLFCEGMVLQRDAEVPVWGWAAPGERVTVEFDGTRETATADTQGKWMLKLAPMLASAEARVMTVSGSRGGKRTEIGNVVVGEVWLCGGQSNMEVGVGYALNPKQEQ